MFESNSSISSESVPEIGQLPDEASVGSVGRSSREEIVKRVVESPVEDLGTKEHIGREFLKVIETARLRFSLPKMAVLEIARTVIAKLEVETKNIIGDRGRAEPEANHTGALSAAVNRFFVDGFDSPQKLDENIPHDSSKDRSEGKKYAKVEKFLTQQFRGLTTIGKTTVKHSGTALRDQESTIEQSFARVNVTSTSPGENSGGSGILLKVSEILKDYFVSSELAKILDGPQNTKDFAANLGSITVNEKPIVGRSARTDTSDKILQLLVYNALEAIKANEGQLDSAVGFHNGEYCMVTTSAMDYGSIFYKSKALDAESWAKRSLGKIKNVSLKGFGSAIAEKLGVNRKRINAQPDSAGGGSQSFIELAEVATSKLKARNNERKGFLKIEESINQLFHGKDLIEVEVPDEILDKLNIASVDRGRSDRFVLKIRKPVLTNLTLSNVSRFKQVVGRQREYNREHAIEPLAKAFFKKLREKNQDLTEVFKFGEIVSGRQAVEKEANLTAVFDAAISKVESESSGLSSAEKRNVKQGLTWLFTQYAGSSPDMLGNKKLKSSSLGKAQGEDFLELRGLVEFINFGHSVQCKSGMDRTLTMAALAATKAEVAQVEESGGTVDNETREKLFSQNFISLGHPACFRNRGPHEGEEIKSIIKSVKHDPTKNLFCDKSLRAGNMNGVGPTL